MYIFFNSAQSQLLAGIATIWAAVGLRWTLLERTTWCTLLLIAILSAATLPVSVMCMDGTGIVHGLHSFDGSWYREQGTWWPQTHTYTHTRARSCYILRCKMTGILPSFVNSRNCFCQDKVARWAVGISAFEICSNIFDCIAVLHHS